MSPIPLLCRNARSGDHSSFLLFIVVMFELISVSYYLLFLLVIDLVFIILYCCLRNMLLVAIILPFNV